MRILFVTQWFPPEPGIIIASDIAKGLAEQGHEVHVLTGFPNYPSGRLAEGYRIRPYQREAFWSGQTGSGSVTVHRAPLYPSHDRSIGRRSMNYLSFAVAASMVALLRIPRCDVSLVYSSPATAAMPAMLQRLRGVPYALLIQDLWPDSVFDADFVPSGAARWAARALEAACELAYRGAGAIGVISPGMRELLVSRGVPEQKIAYTPNWVSDDHLAPDLPAGPDARAELGLPTGRTFLYAGNFGDLQNLPALVEAFAKVPEANLALVGDGVMRPALEQLIERLGCHNVQVFPPKPFSDIGRWLAAADVQVVSLRDTPLMRVTMPSKVQTALASGRPVLVAAAGDPASLVTERGAGLAAEPGNQGSLVTAIRDFMALSPEDLGGMSHRSRRAYLDDFSPLTGPQRLAALITAACPIPPHRTTT